MQTKKAVEKSGRGEWRNAGAADDLGSSEPKFEKRKGFDAVFLAVDERPGNVRTPLQTPEKVVAAYQPQVREESGQASWLGIGQPDHLHRLDVVAPEHRVAARAVGETLPSDHQLPVVNV